METVLEKLETEVLKLSRSERAALVRLLLESLDDDRDLDAAWADEVDLRVAEVESGKSGVVPMADAMAEVRARLK